MLAKKEKKRKKGNSLVFPIVLGVLLLAVISFLVVSNWKIDQKRTALNSQIEELQKQVQNLKQQNNQLQTNQSQSQSQDYLEKIAREDLGLQKPGEQAIVVEPAQTSTAQQTQESEPSFWQKLLDKIK